jgi:hypothetical protein
MTKLNRWHPRLEILEDRTPPAYLIPTMPHPLGHAAQHVRPHPHRLSLKGRVTGIWGAESTPPDTGSHQTLTGSGTVQPLGAVGASAFLDVPGFIKVARAHGRLTLANTQGSITLDLVGLLGKGSGVPTTLTYTITGGTGKYAGASGTGKAALQEAPASNPCPPGTVVCTRPVIAPRFTLTF